MLTLSPGQLARLQQRRDEVHKLLDAYDLVLGNETRTTNGHAATLLPDKLRTVVAQEANARSHWTAFTHEVYRIVATQPALAALTIHEVRAQLNGSAPVSQVKLSNTLARLKSAKYFTGGYGKYRLNPKRTAPLALPPAPAPMASLSPAAAVARVIKSAKTKKKKRQDNSPEARAKGQRTSVALIAALDEPRTREELIEALRGVNRKRSIVEASTMVNAIGPLVRRGYIKRQGDRYVKVRDYEPRGV